MMSLKHINNKEFVGQSSSFPSWESFEQNKYIYSMYGHGEKKQYLSCQGHLRHLDIRMQGLKKT